MEEEQQEQEQEQERGESSFCIFPWQCAGPT
jgi:hypothetical protein